MRSAFASEGQGQQVETCTGATGTEESAGAAQHCDGPAATQISAQACLQLSARFTQWWHACFHQTGLIVVARLEHSRQWDTAGPSVSLNSGTCTDCLVSHSTLLHSRATTARSCAPPCRARISGSWPAPACCCAAAGHAAPPGAR